MTLLTARRTPVTTTYHGVEVTEDYRWLEDAAAEETVTWASGQLLRTREYFDAIPWRGALRARVEELIKAESTSYSGLSAAGGSCFALKTQPPKQQTFVVALADLDDLAGERVVVDPNEIDPSGATSIDFFVPSPDGTRIAVSLSEHGTEDGTLHVFDVATGEVVDEPIPHVNSGTSGGSMTWRGDGAGFWYTLSADPAGFEQQVWFRELGGPADRLELADGFADPRISENFLSSHGRWVLDWVQKGDGSEWQLFARSRASDDGWWQVAGLDDLCVQPFGGSTALVGDALFLLCRRDASRGKVLRLALTPGATVADAEEVVAEGDLDIEDLAATAGTLWVAYTDGGPQQLRAFGLDGAPRGAVELPQVSTVSTYVDRIAPVGPDRVAWPVDSFTHPTTWWLAVDGESPRPTALRTTTSVDLSGYEVTREFATSKDGTRVPLHIIAASGTPRDGSAPAILYGYGGYGLSIVPRFHVDWLPWLEQGGVFVVGNIRGGGEYGESWHLGGCLTTKQNPFDDFIACADHLVSTGVTRRERLAIMGASNGGLLMGAVLTQRPDLARAVVAMVAILDMLRVETGANGAFNVAEFGTVEDPGQFAALYAYSPYHRVVDGTAYPAVLLTGSENDPRVESWHPKKMAARLQAATSSNEPVLLRMDDAGHGVHASLDQRVEELTDVYAFIFDRLGLGYVRGGS
jgi:prolyl oligopeptidase